MKCSYCGNELPDNARFCRFCGKKLSVWNGDHEPVKAGSEEPGRTKSTGSLWDDFAVDDMDKSWGNDRRTSPSGNDWEKPSYDPDPGRWGMEEKKRKGERPDAGWKAAGEENWKPAAEDSWKPAEEDNWKPAGGNSPKKGGGFLKFIIAGIVLIALIAAIIFGVKKIQQRGLPGGSSSGYNPEPAVEEPAVEEPVDEEADDSYEDESADSGGQEESYEESEYNQGTEYQEESYNQYDQTVEETPYVPAESAPSGGQTGYILSGSDSRYISSSELNGFTKDQCRLARNEIYARHGRKFADQTLQQYFNNCSWYRGTIEPDSFNENSLNAYERANLDTIVAFEISRGYRTQ